MPKTTGVVVHGLASCDTCRKARKWLDAEGVAYTFRDLAADAPSQAEVKRWSKAVGAAKLLNKASTTWRALPEAVKAPANDADVIALLVEHPKLVKRPVLEAGESILSGFSEAAWREVVGARR